jgi:predicted P-loop ATPase
VAWYQQGEQWWLRDDENSFNNTRNSSYRRPDPIIEAVDEYLSTNPTIWGVSSEDSQYEPDSAFTLKQLVEVGLDKKLADIKPNVAQNIELHLMKLGWRKVRQRVMAKENGSTVYKRITCFRKLKGFISEYDDPMQEEPRQ